jgi:hypothetical protein
MVVRHVNHVAYGVVGEAICKRVLSSDTYHFDKSSVYTD